MKRNPRKAFVLAAGFGTRMLPLTKSLPKPLMPLWGRSLLTRTLEMLRGWGVESVCVNAHHLPEAIRDHLTRRPVSGLDVSISHEPEILGTGGALPFARWFFRDDEPFWMVNADVALRADPAPLLRAFGKTSDLAACWLTAEAGPRTVEMTARRGVGAITNFRSKRPATDGTYTFCGLQLLSPRILDFLPASGFATIVDGYEEAMRAGHAIAGVEIPGSFWADLGTPAQYLAAHAAIRKRRTFVSLSPGATVAKGAKLENVVAWPDAQIGPRAVLRDAIVGAGCRVDFPMTGIAMRAVDALAPPELALLRAAGWRDDAVAVPLGARGSARAFTRMRQGAKKAILVHYDATRVENPLYAGHARFLASCKFPVPRVLADDPAGCATLLEDLGDASIQNTIPRNDEKALERVYRRVLDAVLVLHGPASRRARELDLHMVPAFRPRLYKWEREYFAEHMLQKRLGLSGEAIDPICRDLQGIGRRLLRAPLVVVHRDLQSSNVILKAGRPWFIDFQGMRWGPAVYDLASLLCDPYMELSEPLTLRLLDHYAAKSPDPDGIRALFWPAAIQRLSQALGAYARLGASRETRQFAAYIEPALRMMKRALGHVSGLPHLKAWVAATKG